LGNQFITGFEYHNLVINFGRSSLPVHSSSAGTSPQHHAEVPTNAEVSQIYEVDILGMGLLVKGPMHPPPGTRRCP
jgi:hypothetical protein